MLSLSLVAAGALACDAMPGGSIEHRALPGTGDGGDDDTKGDDTKGESTCADDTKGEDDTKGDDSGGEDDTKGDDSGGYEKGCTLTQGYWKTHHAYAKNESQKLPWPLPEGAKICGKTWLELLHTPPKGDPHVVAAHQLIAAELNVASGAEPPLEVADAMSKLKVYVNKCEPCAAGKQQALSLAELLDDFNNGKVGPGHCDKGGGGPVEDYDYNYGVDICNGKVKAKNEFVLKNK